MKKFPLLFFFFILCDVAVAQTGKITGKVISILSGQPLSNASVTLVEKNKTVAADQNGNFSFNGLAAGNYSVKCSNVGYEEKIVVDIFVKEKDNTVISISLEEKKITDKEVVITTRRISAARETISSLLVAQKNAASVSDGISAESIRKTPDRSTSDVLKRVSGASIQDDRFAIVRGLNDRYNGAFINGAPLPSTESDRKAFAFDIFPSSILDNLVIYKTATPDMSGEFAGGAIHLTTKSIPANNFTSVSVSGGYNSLITGKDIYSPEVKGGRDWLGVDDGTRAIPQAVPSVKEINNMSPAEQADLAKLFGHYRWGVKKGKAAPNFNFQLAKGVVIERKQKEFLGALLSVSYSRNKTFTEGERNSYNFDVSVPAEGQELVQNGKYVDSVYNDEVVLAALGNVSVKLDNNNSLSWKSNYSINTDNKLVKRAGSPNTTSEPDIFLKDVVRWYTSNKIYSSQLSGEHQLAKTKTKINWIAAYSKVNRDIPNLSRTSYGGSYSSPADLYASFSFGPPNQTAGMGTMFFAKTKEDIKSIKADATQSYTLGKSTQNLVKVGGGYQFRERAFGSRVLGFAQYNGPGVAFDYSLNQLPEDQIFLPGHLGKMENGMGGYLLKDGTGANSDYNASSALTHAYIMTDQRFFKTLRLIYGVRLESFNQKLNAIKNLRDTINLNTSIKDFLPSVNVVYALTSKMNVRLSFSQTVNRPEFRELAPFLFFDYVTTFTYEGYEKLKRAKIKNYDFRYEFFPGKAQLFSVSAFYKDFTDPVEFIQIPNTSNQTIYVNNKSAKVYGVEAEFRTLLSTLAGTRNEHSLLNKFTLAANVAVTSSSIKIDSLFGYGPEQLVTNRSLQGQSPYLVNGSLAFNDDKCGFSSTISINRIGDRVFIAGTYNVADIYEKARTVVDFQLAKFFLKEKLEFRFTARDLLAQRVRFYYDFDKSKSYSSYDRFFSSVTAPRVYTLSAVFRF